jgi:hypothetical protein
MTQRRGSISMACASRLRTISSWIFSRVAQPAGSCPVYPAGVGPGQADAGAAAGQIPYQRPGGVGVLTQVRVCCDTPQEASVVDALASFGVVRADVPLTLANIWLAIQGPACPEGPARQCFP